MKNFKVGDKVTVHCKCKEIRKTPQQILKIEENYYYLKGYEDVGVFDCEDLKPANTHIIKKRLNIE